MKTPIPVLHRIRTSRGAKRLPVAGVASALAIGLAVIVWVQFVPAKWLEPQNGLGDWTAMETRQLTVSLVPGRTVVEIQDTVDGWSERVVVESDGSSVVDGVPIKRLVLASDQPIDGESARFWSQEVGSVLSTANSTIERADLLSDWIGRRTYGRRAAEGSQKGKVRPDPIVSADGREILASIDQGTSFNCLSLANLYYDVGRASGLNVRRVDLTLRHLAPYEAHAVVEVWCPEQENWILLDPTYTLRYEVDGHAANALDLHRAVVEGRFEAIRVLRAADAPGADPWTCDVNPVLLFRYLYLRLPPGQPPYLSLTDPATPVAPIARQAFAYTDSEAAFAVRGDASSPDLPIRLGSSRGRIVYQVLGGKLYVCLNDGLFVYGRFRARATEGLSVAFTPEVQPHDLADSALCAEGELFSARGFADTDGDSMPDGWVVSGFPKLVERGPDGELIVETGNTECEFAAEVAAQSPTPIIASIKMQVERGRVSVSLRKDERCRLWVDPGPMATVSPYVGHTRRRAPDVRLVFEPGTRCVVESVSVRRALTLAELCDSADAPRALDNTLTNTTAHR
jgi:hypothetical protein